MQASNQTLTFSSLRHGVSQEIYLRSVCLLTSAAVVPPGKLVGGRADLFDGEASEKFWEWNEEQVKPYV